MSDTDIDKFTSLDVFKQTGYVVLDPHEQATDPTEWLDLEYVDWRSSGVTRFAPLASAFGEIECDGFWNHKPREGSSVVAPRTDKDGIWIDEQTEKAPKLTERAKEPGANVGRCRVIELQPNEYADCIYNLHRDDNNRLNPEGTGWIVRGFFNLTDNPDSVMILREDRDDPATEHRIPLPAGAQLIVDTQRLWHAVWHEGDEPRYCLITSWESGPELGAYIDARNPKPVVDSKPLTDEAIAAAQTEVERRRAERAAKLAQQNKSDVEVMSEA